MDVANLPWEKGVSVVFAMLLLKILWDCVYRKIPRGFKSLKASVDTQTTILSQRHDDLLVKVSALEKSQQHADTTNAESLKRIEQLLMKSSRKQPAKKKSP